MIAYMTEISVANYAVSVAWYRDVLGLRVELADPANGFALLACEGGGRLALKAGTPTPGGVKLHYEVDDVSAELARLGQRPRSRRVTRATAGQSSTTRTGTPSYCSRGSADGHGHAKISVTACPCPSFVA